MAEREVGGIKVRIGADTSALDAAASHVQSELGKVSKSADALGRSMRSSETAAQRFARSIDEDTRALRGFDAIAARARQQAEYLTNQINQLSMHDIRNEDIQAYGRELDDLRAKFNPLFAASRQYEAELDEINRAHRIGAINAQEQAAAMAALDARYTAGTAQANAFSGATATNSAQLSNVTAQFNDIGVMMASGQSPFLLAIQQGTQLSQVLNQVEKPLEYLKQGFLQMLNPISLVTIGAIAAAATVTQWLMGMASDTREATTLVQAHGEAIRGIVTGYDDAMDAADRYLSAIERMPRVLAIEGIEREFEELNGTLAQFERDIETFSGSIMDAAIGPEWLRRATADLVKEYRDGKRDVVSFYQAIADLAREAGIAEGAVFSLGGDITSIIALLRDGAMAAIQFGDSINRGVAQSHILSGLANDARLEGALALRSYVTEQERLNAMTTDELALLSEVEKHRRNIESLNGDVAISEERLIELAEESIAAEARRRKEIEDARMSLRDDKNSEREQEALMTRLEAMQLALATEEEAERISYERRLEELRSFLDAKLVTEQEYQDMLTAAAQIHNDNLSDIAQKQVDEENRIRSQLVGNAASIFGSLSSLMNSFGEEGLAAAKAFGVAQAVINTAEGITKAWAQGGMLGFVGAAAVAAAGAAQIATILSASKGTSTRPSPGAPPPAETPQMQQSFYIRGINPSDMFTGAQLLDLIDNINGAVQDGAKIMIRPV